MVLVVVLMGVAGSVPAQDAADEDAFLLKAKLTHVCKALRRIEFSMDAQRQWYLALRGDLYRSGDRANADPMAEIIRIQEEEHRQAKLAISASCPPA